MTNKAYAIRSNYAFVNVWSLIPKRKCPGINVCIVNFNARFSMKKGFGKQLVIKQGVKHIKTACGEGSLQAV